eukprot:CAMPEP_0194510150 /NCGR_PEP_ID=MMETSP0253-20130528/41431_1 /TAXON_ID=2966 /ORGANISM="Noctiluca scintillans" /LENGTH=66 /DNA_ID=CAMNT_0039353371 /DNA_START=71 /DNA_END=271 /DNA_ORIENTATION=-
MAYFVTHLTAEFFGMSVPMAIPVGLFVAKQMQRLQFWILDRAAAKRAEAKQSEDRRAAKAAKKKQK